MLRIGMKPFTFFYFIPIVYFLIDKFKLRSFHEYLYVLKKYAWFGILVGLPFLLWRQWESYHPEGIPYYEWIFNGDGIMFKPSFWRWIFGERLGYMILGTWGLIPFAYGLLKKTKNYFIHFFLLGMFIY